MAENSLQSVLHQPEKTMNQFPESLKSDKYSPCNSDYCIGLSVDK